MRRGRHLTAIAVVALGAGVAQPAAARAPLAQLRSLRAGTAIVQFDRRATTAARLAGLAGGARVHRFQALPFVSVRGPLVTLRRVASARGVTAVHMNQRIAYYLHESVPVAFGGNPGQPAASWAAGYDG